MPEYFPPLLLLIKQRMSSISSSSTMALTTPMNQPCVAKLVCTSFTPSEGNREEGGERREYGVFVSSKQDESTIGVKRMKKVGETR